MEENLSPPPEEIKDIVDALDEVLEPDALPNMQTILTAQALAIEARDRALREREEALHRRELAAEALTLLEEKGLPRALLPVLNLADSDTVRQGVAQIEAAFRTAMRENFLSLVAGLAPKAGNPAGDAQRSISTLFGNKGE